MPHLLRTSVFVLLAWASAPGTVRSQALAPDSVPPAVAATLPAVAVAGYETHRPLLRTAAAVGLLNRADLTRTDQTSLVAAFNTLPGVRLEERAPGSYRLSIRGSTLRSPYGVRNVKLYLDELPFTGADGVTLLQVLDPTQLGRVEVLRGPAGSAFGAGTGGAVRLITRPAPAHQTTAEVSATAGSFGLRRGTATVATATEHAGLRLTYAHQRATGYRQQSALARQTLLARATVAATARQTVALTALYTHLHYELPGGISGAQWAADPRQVRPLAKANQSAITYRYALGGLTHTARFAGERGEVLTSGYGAFIDKDNPFTFNYERTTAHELGGRLRATYRTAVLGYPTTLMVGGETQRRFTVARTYDNHLGQPDTLRADDEQTAAPAFTFGQAEVELPAGVLLTAGASYARTRYYLRRLHPPGLPAAAALARDFRPVVSPRVAVLKSVGPRWAAHGSLSSGFAPPTLEELLPSGASFDQHLQPERGTTYELGLRGTTAGQRLSIDVVAFALGLRQTIVSQRDTSGVLAFRNAGTTRQRGLELQARYQLRRPGVAAPRLTLWSSYTFSAFRFGSYATAAGDFSGRRLPGVAPHVLVSGFDGSLPGGFSAGFTATYSAALPLTDANTVWAAPWWVLNAQFSWQRALGPHLTLRLLAGFNNLTDARYSLGHDFNDARGNYYQPAAARNWYGGLALNWQ